MIILNIDPRIYLPSDTISIFFKLSFYGISHLVNYYICDAIPQLTCP